MVIVIKKYGNHSNRLFQSINIEAFCLENKIRFYNPSLSDMFRYYGIKHNLLHRMLLLFSRLLVVMKLKESIEFGDFTKIKQYINDILNQKLLLVHGWCFSIPELNKKYRTYFIKKYSLLPKYYKNNKILEKVELINRQEVLLVGVHIRRGDYKTWADGKYFFSDETYLKYMDNFSASLDMNTKKKHLFIIFSDESINFIENEKVIISKNPWYIDHLIMSKCDYLIGPPSTFTLWASYLGGVKYFHIENNSGAISINDFKICCG